MVVEEEMRGDGADPEHREHPDLRKHVQRVSIPGGGTGTAKTGTAKIGTAKTGTAKNGTAKNGSLICYLH